VTFSDGTSLQMTPSHPIWTNNGWRSLDPIISLDEHGILPSWLQIGDKVESYFGTIEVTDIQEMIIPKHFDTFDFEVEDCHTFLAEGIPVHNALLTGGSGPARDDGGGPGGSKAKGNATWMNPTRKSYAKGVTTG
jgi:hypothetical protein